MHDLWPVVVGVLGAMGWDAWRRYLQRQAQDVRAALDAQSSRVEELATEVRALHTEAAEARRMAGNTSAAVLGQRRIRR